MGCFCCINDVGACEDDPNLIIDVEKVLVEAAWNIFTIAHGKFERRFLKRKRYRIEVPMNYYHFEQVESEVTGRAPHLPGGAGLGKHDGKSLLTGKPLAHGDRTGPGHMGLETEFNNDTDEKQTYTFQFEKIRTASVDVTYQRGFSIGAKANFSIGLPKVMGDGSVGVDIEKQLQITKATGERFEESMKTSASSDIVVAPRSRYVASVVMEERELVANFRVVVEMSMPAGKAPTYITDLKTGEVVFVRTVNNLPRNFRKFKHGVETVTDPATGTVRNDAVRFTVNGIVTGVQLSTHKINLYTNASLSEVEVQLKRQESLKEEKEKKELARKGIVGKSSDKISGSTANGELIDLAG